MRILHVTDTYAPTVGGIEVLVRTLAGGQAALGHDVTVLTRTPDRRLGTSPAATFEVCREPRALASLAASADVVHGHVSAMSPLALHALEVGARGAVPAMATVHSVWGSAWPLFRAAATLRGWSDLPIQWAAVSEVAAGPVRRALAGHDVLVVPNAVDTGFWAPEGTPRHTDVVTLVAAMRMASRKRRVRRAARFPSWPRILAQVEPLRNEKSCYLRRRARVTLASATSTTTRRSTL
jgi:glycosyltransferase involved in cell wall biosynthesis